MKAVIVPSADTAALAPLTSWLPEFLLPIVNKPLVEHLIELLARHGIKDILLVLKHRPFETEEYLGDGSRWGVHLSYSLLGTYRGVADALGRLDASRLGDPFIGLPGHIVTDLDLTHFVDDFRQGRGDVGLAETSTGDHDPGLRSLGAEAWAGFEANPFIMTWQAFNLMKGLQLSPDSLAGATKPSGQTLSLHVCEVAGTLERIQSPVDLLRINQRVLTGDFSGLIIPARRVEEGIWVGRHCRLHPTARLKAPTLIGDHCNIQREAVIGSGSLIGSQVIVDEGASVQGSLVMDRTYVGSQTDLKDAIVKQNWILLIPSLLSVHLGDDLILGDLGKKMFAIRGDRLLNLGVALILFVLASPVLILLYLYHLVVPSKNFFFSKTIFGSDEQKDLEGNVIPKPFDLYAFNSSNRLVRKLPGLINVIRGELNLVGVSALDEEERRELPAEWREMRAKAPVGLFHLWELERQQDLEWEEKMVMENYYAVSRSAWGDLKILGKALLATAVG